MEPILKSTFNIQFRLVRICLTNENQIKLLHAQMILDEENVTKLALIFRDKLWFVSINETDLPLYTSDNPIVRYGHCNQMGFKQGYRNSISY